MSKPDKLFPAMTEVPPDFRSLTALLSESEPIPQEVLQSVFTDDVFQSPLPERSTDSEDDELHVKLELVARVLGTTVTRLKKDYKRFCRARAEALAEQEVAQRRREKSSNRLKKSKQKQSQKKQKQKQVNAPAGCFYRPEKPLTKPTTAPMPEPILMPELIQSVLPEPEVSMDLRLDFAYCDKPIGKQPDAMDRAMIGMALAVDAGKTQVDEVYEFLTERLGLEDYIESADSYYQDTSGILRVVRRQLTTAGYILVSKSGTVQITPEGRVKLQGMNGKAVSAGVIIDQPVTLPETKETPTIEISKLREAIAEHEQLLLISTEEEAINAAAIQGIEAQIPTVRAKLAQAQREFDTLINRKSSVEAKIIQNKKEQADLRQEIEKLAVQLPILEQVLI